MKVPFKKKFFFKKNVSDTKRPQDTGRSCVTDVVMNPGVSRVTKAQTGACRGCTALLPP